MKIGILTQPLIGNHGGILQNYALQVILRDLGHDVYTIDRDYPQKSLYKKTGSVLKRTFQWFFNRNIYIRSWQTENEKNIISKNAQDFVDKYIHKTKRIVTTRELKKIHQQYKFDAYIVGSDQVWRPKYSPCLINYFLDFLQNDNSVKKISYAASFGVDYWEFTKKQTVECRRLIKTFNAISVRENSGIHLCKEYLKVSAIRLLDPTMLLQKDSYVQLVEECNTPLSKGNMLIYFLDKTKEKQMLANRISKSKKLIPFDVMPEEYFNLNNRKQDINNCVFPPVTKWIRAFMDAEFIITDSYHGTIFSIIFGKSFLTIGNSQRGMTRFETLLSTFSLQHRLIFDTEINLDTILDNNINYEVVYEILNKEKGKCLNFINDNLKKN
ncbi:MAG: polysaccharide pyruvyl transferase family protein [Tissierellia bacterium]|nr:polysaccharide pyruvyl transferase family protein [Tissierellia bacterium]